MLNSFRHNDSYIIPLICNTQHCDSQGGLFKLAVPLPLGLAPSLSHLCLQSADSKIDCNAQITSCWHDGSIKWLTLDFFATKHKNSYSLVINIDDTPANNINQGITTDLKNNVIKLNANNSIFSFDLTSSHFKWACKKTDGEINKGYLALLAQQDDLFETRVTTHKCESFYNLTDGTVQKLALHVSLQHHNQSTDTLLNSTLIFTLYNAQNVLSIEHNLHNPKAAKHPNGHWDLGDENSIQFRSLGLVFELLTINSIALKKHQNDEWHEVTDGAFNLHQFSSGGEAWQSLVHVDQNNIVTLNQQGARLSSSNQPITSVTRAQPNVRVNAELNLTMEQFWQNFPKKLSVGDNKIEFEYFPASEQLHELQAGESKTHTLWLAHNVEQEALNWVHQPHRLSVPNAWLELANICQFGFNVNNSDRLAPIIQAAINGSDSFFVKREKVDEYGWRNFGDLYADHETAYYSGEDLFVSHYNNQYDPIFGFLKQYLISGETAWFGLADDLAKHVKNIDIYQTTEDKAEYNGGLF